MIPAAHYAMLKRLLAQPAIERPYLLRVAPSVHKVAGMHKNISIGKALDPVVEAVGVGNDHKAHWSTSVSRTRNAVIALDSPA